MRKRKWKSRKGAALLALALAFVLGLSGTGLLDTQAAGPLTFCRSAWSFSAYSKASFSFPFWYCFLKFPKDNKPSSFLMVCPYCLA